MKQAICKRCYDTGICDTKSGDKVRCACGAGDDIQILSVVHRREHVIEKKTERLDAYREAAIAAAKADGVVSSNYASARAVWALWWAERDRLMRAGGVP